MLVLSRKQQEWITIDGNIRIVVVEIMGNKVRLGFEAPPHITILRDNAGEKKPRNGVRHVT